MSDIETLVMEAVRRLELRLAEREALSRANILLASADPSIVLPSPACAQVEVTTRSTWNPESTQAFRTLEAYGRRASETLFVPIVPELQAHPWNVQSIQWLDSDRSGQLPTRSSTRRRGIRVTLAREPGSTASPGQLVLLGDDATSQYAFRGARATVNGTRVTWDRASASLGGGVGVYPFSSGLSHRLEALLANVYTVGLPASALGGYEIVLEVLFSEPVITEQAAPPPSLRANVLPVWNSLDVLSPSLAAASQAVSEAESRYVHPLDTRSLGSGWTAWRVIRAGAAGAERMPLRPRAGEVDDLPRFHLAYVPASHSNRMSGGAVLSVVLSKEARKRLDASGRALAVDFCATTGSDANDIPDQDELQLIDVRGLPTAARVSASMVGASWGGSDGFPIEALAELPPEIPHALMPAPSSRTVADVEHVVRRVFGDRIEVVAPRDLLRCRASGTVTPLAVRVRFRRADLPTAERRQVMRACQGFLNDYLAGQPVGGFRLVDVGGMDDELTA